MTRDEAREAERIAGDSAAREEGMSFVGQDDLRRLEPAVSQAALGALHLPRSSWVDNVRLVRALVRAGERRGVRYLLGQPVEALVRTGNRVTGVRAGAPRDHRGGHGRPGRRRMERGDRRGPGRADVRPVKGQILALDNAAGLVSHVIFRDDVYVVPRLSGECLFGATVEDGVADRDVTLDGLAWLLEEAFNTVPGLGRVRFLRAWAGIRPATEDGLPVVGPWPGAPGSSSPPATTGTAFS